MVFYPSGRHSESYFSRSSASGHGGSDVRQGVERAYRSLFV